MDSKFQAVKSGCYTPYSKHIEVRRLDKCIKYLKRWNRLCKAIAYSMVTPIGERSNREWAIVFRALNSSIDLTNVAVYTLVDEPNEPHTFNDIVVVDYIVLRSKEKEQFLSKYPQLRELIFVELRLITYG